jgi:hypothetical protein
VLPPVHEQSGDQVWLPIAGYGFRLDAFDVKDRDVLKQPPQRFAARASASFIG